MKNQELKNNQKGIIQILLVVGIVLALGVIGYVVAGQYKLKQESLKVVSVPDTYKDEYKQSSDSVTAINNSSDLDNTSNTLEASDETQIDAELTQLDKDFSSF